MKTEKAVAMAPPSNDQDRAKRAAAERAIAAYLRDGMKIGLGSGTTSHLFVRALGARVRAGLSVLGVPTSIPTRDLARELGIALADLNDVDELDLTIDGADEVDPKGDMIKGGGGCHLWEKMVANASKRMVVLVDDSKRVETLGRFPLPVEVVRFGWMQTRRQLRLLFAEMGYADTAVGLRGGDAKPFVTDSGHYILDCRLERIPESRVLAPRVKDIPGVVEHGLFIGVADAMVVGHRDGTADIVAF